MQTLVTYAKRALEPIALAEVVSKFPTVAQSTAHESRSERFRAITTLDVLESLENDGFQIFQAHRVGAKGARQGFEKHEIVLRHKDYGVADVDVDEVVPELHLFNANDGTASYKLLAGMLRKVCSNGLMVGHSFGSVRVAHVGDVVRKVRDGAANVVEMFRPMLEQKTAMESRAMAEHEIAEFVNRAALLRFDNRDAIPFRPERLAQARRHNDHAPTLWHVFNRVQENMIVGGIRGHVIDEHNRVRRTTMRAVNAIDTSVKINRGLWDIATEYVDITPRPLAAKDLAAA
jgi:hypothetical protein